MSEHYTTVHKDIHINLKTHEHTQTHRNTNIGAHIHINTATLGNIQEQTLSSTLTPIK